MTVAASKGLADVGFSACAGCEPFTDRRSKAVPDPAAGSRCLSSLDRDTVAAAAVDIGTDDLLEFVRLAAYVVTNGALPIDRRIPG